MQLAEWMGFGLLHQSMLDTVIVARDKCAPPFFFFFVTLDPRVE